jgi:hypothetical protein
LGATLSKLRIAVNHRVSKNFVLRGHQFSAYNAGYVTVP